MQIVLADNAVAAISQNSGIGMAMRFQRQAEQIVEWKLNDLRVKQERVLMRQAGHAVPLSFGVCSAVIGVSATGSFPLLLPDRTFAKINLAITDFLIIELMQC